MAARKTNAKVRKAAKVRHHKPMAETTNEDVKKEEVKSEDVAKENETANAAATTDEKTAQDTAAAEAEAAKTAQAQKDERATKEKEELAKRTVVYHLERGADVDATIVGEPNADGSVNLELIVPELHQHFLKDDERGAAVPKRENVSEGTGVGSFSRK